MDVMHLPSSNRNKYILIVVDLFTRWPEAFALQNINGSALVTCMLKVMTRQGFIRQLLCDNASYNVGKEFSTFCDREGIKLSPVSEYHPEANGVAESKVKALKDLLRALATKYSDWSKYLDTALFAYRTSYHPIIKDTPFFLNHGRDPWFPNWSNKIWKIDRKSCLLKLILFLTILTLDNQSCSTIQLSLKVNILSFTNIGKDLTPLWKK
jgi:hypothetical protein